MTPHDSLSPSPASDPNALPATAKISAWSLIRPYWVSEDRWIGWSLLLLIVLMNLGLVYINVRINTWSADFYNALQGKDAKAFWHLIGVFGILAFIFIMIAVYTRYFQQMLSFRWRQWLTGTYLKRWLGDGVFYRIERDKLADNPDQRISDDLQSLASSTLSLSLDLLSTLVTLGSFVFILWRVGGAISVGLSGHEFSIPGYMVWVAALYALFGSLIMQKFGGPLVSVNYQQQRVEADFRFGLIRLRENSEQIAFYNGAATEDENMRGLFGRIRANWLLVMKFTKRLTFVNSFYAQLAFIFPILVASPRFFSGAITFGVLMQVRSAFGTVSDSFSWFINSYSSLADWRATVNRLREFTRVMNTQHFSEAASPATVHGGINRHLVDREGLETHDLVLALPNGEALTEIGSRHLRAGARWLVRGPSGCGKSTLMRALAGLWPFGDGSIDVPINARVMFVPQQSYVPIGTLKAALCYPSNQAAFTDEACQAVLVQCRLPAYANLLATSEHWARRMSPGEQQRLAAARVLLQKPDFLFLDEATSALDAETETWIYQSLVDALPGAAIVSVAHREAVASFHQDTIDLTRALALAA